jgi:putative addiction module component (TIGR02574 family)
MSDFDWVLDGARCLSSDDQLRLIGELWEMVPTGAEMPLHADWAPELERRVAALQAGASKTIPWTTIRDEALAKIGYGQSR